MPPREYRNISKEDLRRKWLAERWEERMAPYHEEGWQSNLRRLRIWKNGEDIMAIVKEYHNPGVNPEIVVRQLRDGDILYLIP